MKYEKMLCDYTEYGERIDYGIVEGGDRLIFLKAGKGGSVYGYEDKYVKMACRLRDIYGCTVICSSNPIGDANSYLNDGKVITQYLSSRGISSTDIYAFGASDGASQVLQLAVGDKRVSRLLLVNMPLMMNPHKLERWLTSLADRSITAVYGENDPSVKYITYLEEYGTEGLKIRTVKGADHQFVGMLTEYIELPDILFEEEI